MVAFVWLYTVVIWVRLDKEAEGGMITLYLYWYVKDIVDRIRGRDELIWRADGCVHIVNDMWCRFICIGVWFISVSVIRRDCWGTYCARVLQGDG